MHVHADGFSVVVSSYRPFEEVRSYRIHGAYNVHRNNTDYCGRGQRGGGGEGEGAGGEEVNNSSVRSDP